ncbi:hypothetical protein [Nocardiopsis salina]|uniref:hypothetical protein n=1 Tax=Nocardiopsis salina TaxID=245836 RepID=UPI00126874D5|nr:hypothetical protein [Nocardiopsis salina]
MGEHTGPAPAPDDAATRTWRTLLQALAVTAVVGAATAVTQLVGDGDALTLATVATTAGTGALMAVGAWVHRKLDRYLERGRG